MAVLHDIVEAHIRPRQVMSRLLRLGKRDDRALAMLLGGCFILFMAQWPYRARQAHLNEVVLTDYIQHDALGLIFTLPLLAYAFAALLRIFTKLFRTKADFYSARLATFWALLAASPAVILSGLIKGFIGPGTMNSIFGFFWFIIFLWILVNSLIEAEQ